MASQEKVHDKDCGGLYERVVLRPGMLGARRVDPSAFGSASWHGEPLAPLLRTLMISGSPVCGFGIVPQHARAQLRRLQDLYMRLDPVPEQIVSIISKSLGSESMSPLTPMGPPITPATLTATGSGTTAQHTSANSPLDSANNATESTSMGTHQNQSTAHALQSLHEVGNHKKDKQIIPNQKRQQFDTDAEADNEDARTGTEIMSSGSHSHSELHPHARKPQLYQKRKMGWKGDQSQRHDSHQSIEDGLLLRRSGMDGSGEQVEVAAAADEKLGKHVWGWGPNSSSAEKVKWWPRMVGLQHST